MSLNIAAKEIYTTPNVMNKREICCSVCDSQKSELLYPDELGDQRPPVDYNFTEETRKTYQIVRCSSCGFIFTNPMPILNDSYVENIDDVYLQSTPQRQTSARVAVEKIKQLKPSGRLLDLGCAIGLFLDEAQKHYQVEGLELSNWAANIAAEKHKIHRKPLSQLTLFEQFDIITLWGVIEHFDNPRLEMEAVFRALKPGGLVAIYTGNVDAWLPRLLGKKWWWYQGMHLSYFSRRTLSRLLVRIGFDVVNYQNYCVYFQLFSLAKSLNRYKIGKLLSPFLHLPGIRNLMVPLKLSGEMVIYAVKRT
jgi:2-polyprenyl-3-methyl-5-hydroxy-6-metoxy-1,4-benzoquinol methylase